MIKQYRMKQLPVEAVQWTGDNIQEVKDLCQQDAAIIRNVELYVQTNSFLIKRYVSPGEYIVRNSDGSFYTVPASVFEETYEEV